MFEQVPGTKSNRSHTFLGVHGGSIGPMDYIHDSRPVVNYRFELIEGPLIQGGVISPLLFTLYIDHLLERLRAVGVGCYIGKTFYGAFGYADDLILLTPNVRSLNTFLNVCKEYAIEYNISFNPAFNPEYYHVTFSIISFCT